MLRNYFKIALRNLWRNRTYGLLNIGGLAVGVVCAALIFLWVQDEVTFDHNQVKRDRLYMVMNNQQYDGATFTFGSTPGPLGPALKTEIPGVTNTARGSQSSRELFSRADKAIYESGSFVDPSFLQMFTFEFVRGSAQTPFPALYSVVISEQMAHKFFGDENPLGQTLKLNNDQPYAVSGVFRDMPANSSFTDQWLAPFAVYGKTNPWHQEWASNSLQTFVELAPEADLARVNEQMFNFIRQHKPDAISSPFLFAMSDWRLRNAFADGKPNGGRIEYVRLFTLVACFILLIACINFMNLATARSEKRAREVGMRKVLGGTKGMLIVQFLGESLVLSFVAVGVAVLLTYLTLPAFNLLVEKQLRLDLTSPIHLAGLVGIGLLTGLLAGSYPSFYLSSFAPVAVLKGLRVSAGSGAGLIRKGLVVFQFTISIVLIVGTVIVYQQIRYVQARQLGYSKSHLLYLTLSDNKPSHIATVRNELLATGVVENAAMSSGSTLELHSNGGGMIWAGKDPSKEILITHEAVGPTYPATIGLKLVAGRDFRPDGASDSANVLINQTLAQLIQKDNPQSGTVVGTLLTHPMGGNFTVVGVVEDFVFNDFYKAPEPLMMMLKPEWTSTLTIRLKEGADLPTTLAKIGEVMKTANPGYPFEYHFMDEEFARHFQSEALIGKLSGVFATLAILISCLGLFGLAAYTAERRTREIGIRKVLGAPVQNLVGLLSKDFLVLVGISCLIAFPLAWWAMSTWLNGYAYRTPIHAWVFGVAGLAALLIALATVSYQAIKAALANPVRSLRAE